MINKRKMILVLILKILAVIIAIPILYALVALILTFIPVNTNQEEVGDKLKVIYLNTNGVHLDIVVNKIELKDGFIDGIKLLEEDQYVSIGWGDKNFYINTPTWGDLTFNVAFKAMLWKSSTLMHVTKYQAKEADWVKVKVTEGQLKRLISFSRASFTEQKGKAVLLEGYNYGNHDEFYEAQGSYSLFKTCNTWANMALKQAGIKTAFWTPVDWGVIRYHNNKPDE